MSKLKVNWEEPQSLILHCSKNIPGGLDAIPVPKAEQMAPGAEFRTSHSPAQLPAPSSPQFRSHSASALTVSALGCHQLPTPEGRPGGSS